MKRATFPSGGTASAEPPSSSRRSFLKAGVTAGGALLLGFRLTPTTAADATPGAFAPDAFIRIAADGTVTLIMPQVEMGQGTYTAIPMILAEELDAAWASVRFEHAPPNDALYGNPTFKEQMTGNSNSIRAFWMPLRKAAAGARAMLVGAAAKRWKVDASTCTTSDGVVSHSPSGRTIAYKDLIGDAAKIDDRSRLREPQLHRRHQALSARKRLAAGLREQCGRVGNAFRPLILDCVHDRGSSFRRIVWRTGSLAIRDAAMQACRTA